MGVIDDMVGPSPPQQPGGGFLSRLFDYALNRSIPSRIAQSAWSGVTAPGDAWLGNIQPDQMNQRAWDMGNAVTLLSGLVPGEANTLRMGAGRQKPFNPMDIAGAPTEEAAAPGITAYHGSPHDFPRFSSNAIGTGEGAQAYGRGLYFAENEGVAQSYRDAMQAVQIGDKSMGPGDADWHFAQVAKGVAGDKISQMDADYISSNFTEAIRQGLSIDNLEKNFLSNYKPGDGMYEAVKATAAEARTAQMKPGHMYQVNINADPNRMLDWDKPLSEQSPYVRDALTQMVKSKPGAEDLIWRHPASGDEINLSQMEDPERAVTERTLRKQGYGKIQPQWQHDLDALGPQGAALGDDPAAQSEALRNAGIPGIKYLDAGSRDAGTGSRNYVVFDDQLISIIRKYGLMGAMAAGLLTAGQAKRAQQLMGQQDASNKAWATAGGT